MRQGLRSRAERWTPTNAPRPGKGEKDGKVTQDPDKDPYWPILSVDQLWVWAVGEKWLITSTTDPLDDMEKTFITAFLDHLNKQAGAGGMHSQPQTTFDISKALVDYCIGAYDRITEGGHRRSVRQIFFQSINDMATKETKLYEKFQKNTEQTAIQEERRKKSSWEANQDIEANIRKATGLSYEVKDVRELIR